MEYFWEGFEKSAGLKDSAVKHGRRAAALLASKFKRPAKNVIESVVKNGPKTPMETIKSYTGRKLIKSQSKRGLDSLSGSASEWLAGKVVGKDKARKAMEKIHGLATEADTRAGALLHKIPGAGKAFVQKEYVPAGKNLTRKVYRTSALAPAAATAKFVVPMAGMAKIEETLDKAREEKRKQGRVNGQV